MIHAFNEKGFAALDPKWSGGRPRRFGPVVREVICRVAKTPPQQLGRPFTTWSLSKLVEHLGGQHRIVISTETVRAILRDADISWQATKTWKGSRDPDFAAKMARILDLYDRPPADGRVICVGEFGPLNLQPRPGRGWFPRGRAARLRATYTRNQRCAAPVRRAGAGQRADVLPLPRPQALAGVPRLPAAAADQVPDGAAVCRVRQLLASQEKPGRRLVRSP